MNRTRLTEPFLDWLARFSALTPDERQRRYRLVDASLKNRHSLDESQIAAMSKQLSVNPEFQQLSRIETNRMLVAIPLVASVPLGVVWGTLAGMLQAALTGSLAISTILWLIAIFILGTAVLSSITIACLIEPDARPQEQWQLRLTLLLAPLQIFPIAMHYARWKWYRSDKNE